MPMSEPGEVVTAATRLAARPSEARGGSVKARYLIATALVAVLAAAGCSSSKSSGGGSQTASGGSKTLTVWLMDGSAPDKLVADLNAEYQAAHAGVTVKYAKQQWNGIQEKLTTALASNNPPDVIELGNTQTAKFASSGALADLSGKVSDLGGQNWLKALTESGAWQGKQFGVPFYAANRVVIYRTDLFKKAGIAPPASLDQWVADGRKLADANKSNGRFMPLYLPGQNWYVLASLIWDNGGALAMPSHTSGQTAPVFLGGSNLAIAAGSKQQDLAYDWLKLLAGEKYQTRLAKENGVLPNSSTLAGATLGGDPVLAAMAKASQNGRIMLNDPAWAAVEAAPNPVKDMLTKVLSGKASAADAAKEASGLITQKMAGS